MPFSEHPDRLIALIIALLGGILGLGLFYMALYFFRKQREPGQIAYGTVGVAAGLRLSLSSLIHFSYISADVYGTLHVFLFILSSWLIAVSLIYLKPAGRTGLIIFFTGCVTAASCIISLGSASEYVRGITLLVFFILIQFSGGYHGVLSLAGRGRSRTLLYVYTLSLTSNLFFLKNYFLGSSRFLPWEICFFFAAVIILLSEARNIALYFSEVEDLTYSLKVTNASLKKSEDLIKKKNDELHHQANHDFLTKLPNRMSLYHMTSTTLKNNYKKNHKVGFLLMDLDRFKQLNDTMGHKMGDCLLSKFSLRIRSTLRNTDQLYRLGGDEFTVMVSEIHREEDLQVVVDKIYRALEVPIELGDMKYRVSSSMGVSLYPDHGSDIDTLLGKADIALYTAKEEGRNRAVFFNESMQGKSDQYFSLRKRLSEALEKNEFSLYFQPQYETDREGNIFGFEALVRLGDGDGGFIPPSLFVPIAEDSGFILPLGNWILERACRITGTWVSRNPELKISVNISASQVRSDCFIEDLLSILEETGFPPENLVLELTESLALNSDERTYRVIRCLRDMGIEIAIDDFGTGFSSLSYLKEFPLDHIKIDKAFIQDIPRSKPDMAIVRSIIEMGDSLNMKIIAEGVEKEEQYLFLKEKGCRIVQGYYTGMPLPADDAARLLHTKITIP